MSRCMRAPQVVRLCVPKLPYVAAAARRRCVRAACNASASPARVHRQKYQGWLHLAHASPRCMAFVRVALYAAPHSSAATRCFLAVIFAVINLSRTQSCTCRLSNRRPRRVAVWRLIISTRGRCQLLKAAAVRLSRFRFSQTRHQNESPQTLDLPTLPLPPHHRLQQLLELLLVADGAREVARDVGSFLRHNQSERGPHVRRQL